MSAVGLLGGGKSLLQHDLSQWRIPLIGINESWRVFPTPWRVFIHPDLQFGPPPEKAFFPLPHKHRSDHEVIASLQDKWPTTELYQIPWIRPTDKFFVPWIEQRGNCHRFRGFDYILETDALSSGLIALELAVYLGFTSIHLLGFDSDTTAHYAGHPTIDPNLAKMWEEKLQDAVTLCRANGITILPYRS